MKPITWMDSFLPKLIGDKTFIPLDVKTVLDVGCGKGTAGALLRNYRSPRYIAGVDAFQPYIEHCERFGCYDYLELHDLGRGKPLPFPTNRFDLVLCLEVVEHLDKANALCLLDELKRVGRHIVVTTPTRFHVQPNLDDNPLQRHRCVITKRDFQAQGFKVRGTGPIRCLGKSLPIESWRLGSLFPSIMQTLVAVREQ